MWCAAVVLWVCFFFNRKAVKAGLDLRHHQEGILSVTYFRLNSERK